MFYSDTNHFIQYQHEHDKEWKWAHFFLNWRNEGRKGTGCEGRLCSTEVTVDTDVKLLVTSQVRFNALSCYTSYVFRFVFLVALVRTRSHMYTWFVQKKDIRKIALSKGLASLEMVVWIFRQPASVSLWLWSFCLRQIEEKHTWSQFGWKFLYASNLHLKPRGGVAFVQQLVARARKMETGNEDHKQPRKWLEWRMAHPCCFGVCFSTLCVWYMYQDLIGMESPLYHIFYLLAERRITWMECSPLRDPNPAIPDWAIKFRL